MKKLILMLAVSGAVSTAQAADLNSCAATYTVASAAFARAGENRDADGAAYLAGRTRLASTQLQWGGNAQLSSQMYQQALSVQQSRFKSSGWTALSQDLSACARIVQQNNIQ